MITCERGLGLVLAILLEAGGGGHFENHDWFGHHFQIREQDYMGDHLKESS